MQSVRRSVSLKSKSSSRAPELRDVERLVKSVAQEFCPFGMVERLAQGVGEPGSAAYHASDVASGEELQSE